MNEDEPYSGNVDLNITHKNGSQVKVGGLVWHGACAGCYLNTQLPSGETIRVVGGVFDFGVSNEAYELMVQAMHSKYRALSRQSIQGTRPFTGVEQEDFSYLDGFFRDVA